MAKMTRRQAGMTFAGVALTVGSTVGSTAAQDEKAKSPQQVSADALLEIVKLRFGTQLDAAKLQAVRQSLMAGLASAGRLRQAPAADEPALIFRAELP